MAKKKYIETPEKLWELFYAYCQHVKANPIKKHVFVGKDGHSDFEEREKPLTMEGFELYCFEGGIIEGVEQYFSNRDDRYKEYVGICLRIKKTIRHDQINGGMTGIFNTSITQRLNGLVEKTDVTTLGQSITNYELTLKI